MGDIADMTLEGLNCAGCGEPLYDGGDVPGHLAYCKECEEATDLDNTKEG